MKQLILRLSQRYEAALRTYLKLGLRVDLRPAVRLGRQALTLGLTVPEVTRIHQLASASLQPAPGKKRTARHAELFLAGTLAPLTSPDRAGRPLGRRTAKLTALHRRLWHGVVRRKRVAAALKKRGRHYAKLLEAAVHRLADARQLTHRVLATQEADRGKMSRELQNEVAQTLLGINVRLLELQRDAWRNTAGFKNEIASTQRLVVKSARSVRRIARKIHFP
ncbi:MAG TPA: hypothetical protein VL527_11920 [Dongiaceae bacterium]|nr:hypothetical protein [Dongiaceae bacterium]